MCITEENEMMIPKEVFDLGAARKVIDDITITSMKANYPQFVKQYGNSVADQKMQSMFLDAWDKNKEEIWQWYDFEWKRIIDEL